MADAAPLPEASRNGAPKLVQPAPRRVSDFPDADFRGYRVRHNGNGGGSNGHGGPVVTSLMVSIAVGAVMIAANWLGLTRSEIDRANAPMREDIANLQAAHGRLDDKLTAEVLRLNREKADNSVRLEAWADLNRRLDAIDRAIAANYDRMRALEARQGGR